MLHCAGVPLPPAERIVRQALAGDVAQRLKHPLARVALHRAVLCEANQRRHRAAASTSMPAARTVMSSELIAVVKSSCKRPLIVSRPRQPCTRAAIWLFAPL